jgi:Ca-activated chloride channel homolog
MGRTRRTGRAALRWTLALGLVALLLVAPPARAATPAPGLLVLLSGSASMRDAVGPMSKAATARRAATALVDGLPAGAGVALRVYGSSIAPGASGSCTDSKRTVDFGANNRAAMLAGLDNYHTSGDAPVAYALTQGADDVKDRSTATIVLVSDGSVGCTTDPCATAAQLVAAHRTLTIDVVGVAASAAGSRR